MAASHSDPKAFADWYEPDYYSRPRPLRRAKVWTALAAGAISLALVGATLWPANRTAYQAGPLSPVHAPFNANCGVCHTDQFPTAARFLPANHAVRAVPDNAVTCDGELAILRPVGVREPWRLRERALWSCRGFESPLVRRLL